MNGIEQYQQNGAKAEVLVADPHRVIQLLMQGFLDRVAAAKGCMERNEIAGKGTLITKAIDIANGLQNSLDMDQGGDISADLAALYDYMTRRLLEANKNNDPEILDEVSRLMRDIKEGWDAIPLDVREQYANEQAQAGVNHG